MIWTTLFAISIAQGLFLLFLILNKGFKNLVSVRLMCVMLAIIIITNSGYLVIRTELVNYVPQLFGLPFGMMFLFGPLFYLYAASVIQPQFKWAGKHWLHFIPYAIFFCGNLRIFTVDTATWQWFIQSFLSGNWPLRTIEKITFGIQIVHMTAYLLWTFRLLDKTRKNSAGVQYIIPLTNRIQWLQQLMIGFSLFVLTIFFSCLFLIYKGYYHPITNYLYTLAALLIQGF